jgi:hypothetical protein
MLIDPKYVVPERSGFACRGSYRLRWRMAERESLTPKAPSPRPPFQPDFSIRKLTPEKFIFRLFEGPVSWEEDPASLEGDLLS